MKSKIIWAAILCAVIFVSFCALEVSRAAKMIQRDEAERRNIQKISLALMSYAGNHGKYPTVLSDLTKDLNTNGQNAMQILHDHFDQHYDYKPGTNGFALAVSALSKWYGKGPRYRVEYEQSKDHDVLKINGAISLESWTKE
jgi:hypothetical protein